MTTATVARHRTRKHTFGHIWDVQTQEITGLWHSIGRVRNCLPDDGRAWDATHRGVNLGIFPTKRAAVQAVVDADAGTS